jgi:hypothetical protein
MKFSDEIYKFWLRPPATVAHQGQRRRFIRPPIFFLGLHADPSASWCSALVLVGFDAKPISAKQRRGQTPARVRERAAAVPIRCFVFVFSLNLHWFGFVFFSIFVFSILNIFFKFQQISILGKF